MFFIFCTAYDTSSSEVFTGSIFPFEITYLNSEAQWGRLLVKELHIEPQQPNLAKGEKSAAQETPAFDCWDSLKHTTKQEHLRGKHIHARIGTHTPTQKHVRADRAPRDSSHTDTAAVPLWH